MKRIVLVFCILILYGQIVPQNIATIDSLNSVLSNAHEVNLKIKTYLELSRLYQNIHLDSSTMMAENAILLAKQIDAEDYIAAAYVRLGHIDVMKDSLEKAMLEYDYSVDFFRKSGDINSLTNVLLIQGNINYVQGNYPEAMRYYMESLQFAKSNNYEVKLAHCYNNIGTVYFTQNKFVKALDCFTMGLNLFEEKGDTISVALAFCNIGSIYVKFNDFEIAKNYYSDAWKTYELLGDDDGITLVLLQLSEIYLKNNLPDSALLYLEKSLRIYQKIDVAYRGPRSTRLASIFTKIGESYLLKKDWVKAIDNFRRGFKIASKTQQNETIRNNAGFISNIYDSLDIIDSSFYYYKIYKNYSDRILNEDNIRNLALMEFQYKLDQQKNEKEMEEKMEQASEKRKNLIYIIVFCGLILLIVLFVLLYFLEKNKKSKIDSERKQLMKDLEYKNKELTTHVLYLLKKNEFIVSISEKLRKIIPSIKIQNKKSIAEVINELDAGSSNDTWKEFEVRFQQVHTSFFDNLNKEHPDLTPNELRLCAFLRLNMTTKDISAITYQSLNSIEIARFRLRKKLGIEKEENLVSFLSRM